jgi:hypothetical protein
MAGAFAAVFAVVAVGVETALGTDQLIVDAAVHLPQRARKRQRHAHARLAGLAALAIRVETALRADQLIVDAAGHTIRANDVVGLACAFVAVEATIAIRVVAALEADRLILDAAGHQAIFANDDDLRAEAIDARGAASAIDVFAAFVAIHALDGHVSRRSEHTAVLVFRAEGNTGVHTWVTEFAGIITEQCRANAFGTPLARIAVVVVAALSAYAGAAEQSCRTIGGAGAAVCGIVLQVFAHAFAAGLTLRTVVQGRATEPGRNADAIAAFLAGDVAAGIVTDAASEFQRGAANVRFLVTLARSAAFAAATVVLKLATQVVAEEALLHANVIDTCPAQRTICDRAALRTEGLPEVFLTTDLIRGAVALTNAADTCLTPIGALNWLADAPNTLLAGITVGKAGTAAASRNTDTVTALFLSGIATIAGSAGKFE